MAIYASVIPRAIETAELLAATWGASVTQDCGLCSWHVPPAADGQLWRTFQAEHGLVGGGVFRPFEDGSESWSELVSRVGRSLETIAARQHGQTVLIVAHAEPISASMMIFGGLPLAPSFDMRVEPTAISEWTTDGDPAAWPRPRWRLVRFNDAAHVAAPV